jgi:hypothetical protein
MTFNATVLNGHAPPNSKIPMLSLDVRNIQDYRKTVEYIFHFQLVKQYLTKTDTSWLVLS